MLGNADNFNLHRKMSLMEMVIADSGDNERSFIIATKAKSFVVQCKVRWSYGIVMSSNSVAPY